MRESNFKVDFTKVNEKFKKEFLHLERVADAVFESGFDSNRAHMLYTFLDELTPKINQGEFINTESISAFNKEIFEFTK